MRIRVLFATLAMISASAAHAYSMELALSDETARFNFSSFVGGFQGGRAQFDAGLLFNEDDDYVINTGLHVIDVAGTKSPGVQLGVGGTVYFADIGDYNALALALGGQVSFRPQNFNRINLSANFHYAPGIVSFVDADSFTEYGARIEYSLLPQADVFLGWTKIETEVENVEVRPVKDAHLGIRISF
ncbi:MAG: hypothetical protein AB1810_01920 [Pseudomonadota bacterium]